MAIPTFISTSPSSASVNPITLAWPTVPAHQADDIGIIITESQDEEITFAGWTPVSGSPISADVGGLLETRLSVFWKRATSGAEADAVSNNPADHVLGRLTVFRGCPTSGDPWDITVTDHEEVADLSVSIPGGTTTVPDCLIVLLCATGQDVGTVGFSGESNGDLVSLAERIDAATTQGSGGRLYMATGEKAAAGLFGATSVTIAGSGEAPKALMMIALKAPAIALNLAAPWVE